MTNKKAFTLIELLGTIVILAVVALITVPIILGVIDKAEKNAFKNSVYGVYDAIDYYYATNLDKSDLIKEFNFSEIVPLKYKGEKLLSGKITIDKKGNKIVSFVTNGKYCANGKNNDIKISDDCISLDESASEIDESKITTTSTTNSITIILGDGFATDEESGIKDYEYIIKKDGKEISKIKTTNQTYTFYDLTHNTEYDITIKVTNNNNKVNEVTIKVSTLKIAQPTISFTNTPNELQNGYLQKQVATITYIDKNVTNPVYYVKTTREGTSSLAITKSCGTGTDPENCTDITSTTSLEANTWYKVNGNVSITYTKTSDTTATIYAAVTDDSGILSDRLTATIDKIDAESPSVTLSTATTSSNSITIPVISSDAHSGLGTATCKYSSTEGKYTEEADSVSTTSCSLTELTKGTTYYYQVCISDKVGNTATCKTGSAKTGTPTKPTVSYTNTPSTLQNGYLKKQVATVTYVKGSVTSTTYYVKTSRAGTSSLAVTKSCGTGTNPGTCTTITSTTSLAANTWYVVSGNVSVTYSTASETTGTIYAAVADNTGNLSETLTGTIDKIDIASPSVTLSTATKTSNTITIPITASDEHSGLGTVTCKYSTTSGSYTTNASSVSTTGCGLTGLAENTTYYYQICVSDKVGNTAPCVTGSTTTKVTLDQPSFAVYSNNPTTAVNGYYKTRQVKVTYTKPASVTGTVNYYIKSTVNATSNTTLTYICGNGTEPGTCTSTSTTSMTAGYWYYQTTSTTPIITETTNGTLYAKIKYSDSASLNGTYTEGNIDSTGPSKPTITLYTGSGGSATASYTSGAWTTADIMTRSQSTDSQSGIQKYQYSHDGKTWSEGYTSWTHSYSSDKTRLDYWITWEGQWNFYIRAIDNLGNVGPASDMFTLRIVKCTSKTVSSYGGWGACSKSCGTGTQSRTIYYVSSIKTDHSCGTGTGTQNCNTQDCCSKTVLETDAGWIDLSMYPDLPTFIGNTSSSDNGSTALTMYPSLDLLRAGANGKTTHVNFASADYGFSVYYTKNFTWDSSTGKFQGKTQMAYCILSYYDGKMCSATNTKVLGNKTIYTFPTTNAGKVQMDQANAIVASVNNASTNGYPLFAWSSKGTQIPTITNSSGVVLSGFPGGTWDVCGAKNGTR